MRLLLLILLGFTSTGFTQGVDVRTEPENPVQGENFEIIFDITTKDDVDPIISFDPYNIEVLSKKELGVSTRSSWINGKVTSERKVSIGYEVISNKAGSAQLRNIVIETNGEKAKYSSHRMRILRVAKRAKNLFALAVTDKQNAYVGESILVRYYVYKSIRATAAQIKKFPKLEKFLKRFHQEKSRNERIVYDGKTYERSLIYTAQLFATKPGKHKVDPISITVNYSDSRSNSYGGGFGGFGGFGRARTKTLVSKTVEINVLPVPVENMPKDFTGLVGKHTFTLKAGKSKYVANEPIEIKLSVRGKGALELFEAPAILSSPIIEEFNSTSNFAIEPTFDATKNYNYTYLGRENGSLPAQKMSMSYFDPESKKFISQTFEIPEIIIAGAQGTVTKINSESKNEIVKKEKSPVVDLNPIYTINNTLIYRARDLIIVISIFFLVIIIYKFYIFLNSNQSTVKDDFYADIKRNGVDYGKLFQLIERLEESGTVVDKIDKSNLSISTKKKLKNILLRCEKDFVDGIQNKHYKIGKDIIADFLSLKQRSDGTI